MITFDRLTILTDTKYISDIQIDKFTRYRTGTLTYKIAKPFSLSLTIKTMPKQGLIIEFTGKLLGPRYKELISLDTIRQCFDNINALGLCHLDTDSMLVDSEVSACDITTDVECSFIRDMNKFMRYNIVSYDLFSAEKKKNGNFEVHKKVDTPSCWKRLTVYDKYHDMTLSRNKMFCNTYGIAPDDFYGKCRFELRMDAIEQVKKTLKLRSASLIKVLQSNATPISDFVNSFLAPETETPMTSIQKYKMELVLADCDYDMNKVAAKLKSLYAEGTGMTKILNPYRELLNERNNHSVQCAEGSMRRRIMQMISSK